MYYAGCGSSNRGAAEPDSWPIEESQTLSLRYFIAILPIDSHNGGILDMPVRLPGSVKGKNETAN